MSIAVEIERIVVDEPALVPGRAERLGELVAAEVTRLLEAEPPPEGSDRDRVRARPLPVAPETERMLARASSRSAWSSPSESSADMTELMHAPEAPSSTLTRSRPHDDAPRGAERDPFTDAQRGMGNQGIQQLLQGFGVQAKLSVSEPGDELEEEADEVANQVLRMEAPTPEALPLEEEDDEKKLGVKRRADSSSGGAAAPAVTPDVGAGISAARSGGLGLPSSEGSFLDRASGAT